MHVSVKWQSIMTQCYLKKCIVIALLYFKGIIVSLIPHIDTPTSIPTYLHTHINTHTRIVKIFFSSFLLTTKASVFKVKNV